jgi:hypothetical protein
MLKYSPETKENNDNFMLLLIPSQHISAGLLDSVRYGLIFLEQCRNRSKNFTVFKTKIEKKRKKRQ